MTNRQLFLNHVAQTSESPLCLEIVKANGCTLIDAAGKEYIDLIGGISVCNIGHRHPKVIEAIKKQLDDYLHIMVYGELVQSPQVQYAKMLTEHLPPSLNSVFFTASGSEATEGAMKLAKRYQNRTQIISFKNSYHGSTQGALSVMGSEYWQQAFRPLLPDVMQLNYNSIEDLDSISGRTACVIAETIQAEAGVIAPHNGWLKALRKKCDETGALLILDEIQCGFGRNGTLWAFEQFDVVPDILLLGKALGGGMPLGAFIADKEIMHAFTHDPVLGHINTFGGHPVCCTAGLAAFNVLLEEKLIEQVSEKEKLFLSLLQHKLIKQVNSCGLMMAVAFENFEVNKKLIDGLLRESGRSGRPESFNHHSENVSSDPGHPDALVFTDWFLFAANCLRIVPPLTISENEIKQACHKIISVLDSM